MKNREGDGGLLELLETLESFDGVMGFAGPQHGARR